MLAIQAIIDDNRAACLLLMNLEIACVQSLVFNSRTISKALWVIDTLLEDICNTPLLPNNSACETTRETKQTYGKYTEWVHVRQLYYLALAAAQRFITEFHSLITSRAGRAAAVSRALELYIFLPSTAVITPNYTTHAYSYIHFSQKWAGGAGRVLFTSTFLMQYLWDYDFSKKSSQAFYIYVIFLFSFWRATNFSLWNNERTWSVYIYSVSGRWRASSRYSRAQHTSHFSLL